MRVADSHALDMYRRIDQDTKSVIHLQDARTFAIIHYLVPHHPFLLNPDGTFHGRDWGENAYERNLAYLDRVIGKLVSELKSAKRYDDSMLILTSDHSWRRDPDIPNPSREELTHVPLIIKLPGQTESQRVDDDFRTCHLGEFIDRALHGKATSPALAVKSAE
jgi:arylsulfatase A-like enzyme